MKWMFFALAISIQAYAGGAVGNGGDAVLCSPSADNSFSGYYALDYLARYSSSQPPAEVATLESSLDRLETLFKTKLPEFLASFLEFRVSIFNETDPSLHRFWNRSEFGLVDLKDEELVTLLPSNCRSGNEAKLVQAVIRLPEGATGRPSGYIVYKYVPEVTEKLRDKDPLQLSFLLAHEWLWDFGERVERNRQINWLLHSQQAESWTREEWLSRLYGLGMTTPLIPKLKGVFPVYHWTGECAKKSQSAIEVEAATLVEEKGIEYLKAQCAWLGREYREKFGVESPSKDYGRVDSPSGAECVAGIHSEDHVCRVRTWGTGLGKNGELLTKWFSDIADSFSRAAVGSQNGCSEFYRKQGISKFICEPYGYDAPKVQ